MTAIQFETAQNDPTTAGPAVSERGVSERGTTEPGNSAFAISQATIDRGVNRGRRMRAQAVAHAFATLGRWVVGTVRSAAGRRATTRLECDECGDMMRA